MGNDETQNHTMPSDAIHIITSKRGSSKQAMPHPPWPPNHAASIPGAGTKAAGRSLRPRPRAAARHTGACRGIAGKGRVGDPTSAKVGKGG